MHRRLAPLLVALALALAACGSTSKSSDTAPENTAGGGPTCADVGAAMKGHFARMPADQAEQATAVVVASCNDDHWSIEARSCVTESDADHVQECKQYLDADVAAGLDAKITTIFDGGDNHPVERDDKPGLDI